MLFDSHCHIDAPEFDTDRDDVLRSARSVGVSHIVVPAYVAERWPSLLALCQRQTHHADWPCLLPALGLHPVYLSQHQDDDLQCLSAALKQSAVVAVGEIGLDKFLPELSQPVHWAKQVALFEAQLHLARESSLPVIIHARRCHADICRALKRVGHRHGGIVHAFSGSIEEACQYRALGMHLGLGGPLTWPQARRLHAVARQLPLDSFVLETDAPDLIPYVHSHQHSDGRVRQPGERVRNSPAFLPSVLTFFAQLRGVPEAELAAQFFSNTVTALHLQTRLNLM